MEHDNARFGAGVRPRTALLVALTALSLTLLALLAPATANAADTADGALGVLYRPVLGNALWRWLAYGGVLVLTLLLSRSVAFFFTHIVAPITRRSRLKVDDLLLGVLRRPVSFLISLSGIVGGLMFIEYDGQPIAQLGPVKGFYFFVLTIVLVYLIARLYGDILRHLLSKWVDGTETKLDDQLLPLAVKGGRFVIWSIGLMIAFSNVGVDVTSLIAGLGIGGLALAMAAKDTIANVFGGASIFADRPFEIGDTITVRGTTGVVEEIGVRTTRIRTFEDTIFVIPNSAVADSPLENVSARKRRKKEVTLGLTYDTSWDRLQEAKGILASILEEAGGIEPDRTIRFDEFADWALVLKVVYWVADVGEYWGKIAWVNEEILRRFNDAGLEFAFPTQKVIQVGP